MSGVERWLEDRAPHQTPFLFVCVVQVTIVPRGNGALGFAQYLPKEIALRTKDQIMDMVCMALAGRASEELHFGRVTTGASDDLRRVTAMVYQMIQVYGMNDRIGQLAFPQQEGGFPEPKKYSEVTAQAMDEEAKKMVDEAYERTLTLLKEQHKGIVSVAEMLLEKETINHSDIVKALGPRPFAGDDQYNEFVSATEDTKDESDAADDADGGVPPLSGVIACRR